MSRARLFCGRSDRLIARIKMMLYAWRFIDQVDGQLVVVWPNLAPRYGDEDVNYSPGLIFDLVEFYATGGADRLVFIESNIKYPANAVDVSSSRFAREAREGFDRAAFVAGGNFVQSLSPQFRFSDEPGSIAYMLGGIKRLFQSLPIHPQIIAARDSFYGRRKLEPGGFEAIHVRRGDVYEMLRNELPDWSSGRLSPARLDVLVGHFVGRTAPLEFYLPAVEAAISRKRKIIFTSDSPEIILEFQKAFGRELFVDLSALQMRIPIQKAFLDFLVLSDAAHIIGTSSNFSLLPAELAGVPFTNVAASGDFLTAERVFQAEFLDKRDGVDNQTRDAALGRLSELYIDFAARREARERAKPPAVTNSVGAGVPD